MATFAAGVNGFMQGAELGMRMRDREDAKKERERRIANEEDDRARRLAREQKQDEDHEFKNAMAAMDVERADALTAMQADIKLHGGADKVPEDVRKSHINKAGDLTYRRAAMLRQRYEPVIKKQTESAKKLLTGLESGDVNLDDVSPQELVNAITLATKRNPSDFLRGDDGTPSKIETGLKATVEGLKSGDTNVLREGTNVLMQPELSVGLGDIAPDGSEIIGKEVERFIPAPNDPSKVYPVLRVKTRRGDGAEGAYLAPRTHGRTSHEQDDVAPPISIDTALDRAGRLGSLAQVLNAPGVREKIIEGIKDSPQIDSLLKAVYATGGNLDKLTGKLKTQVVDLGDRKGLITTDEEGNVVKETTLKKGIDPDKAADRQTRELVAKTHAAKDGPEARRLGVIRDYAGEHGISEDEAATELQERGVLGGVRRGGAGASSDGAKPLKENEIKGAVNSGLKQILVDIERRPGKTRGEYVKPNGAPATPLEAEQINAAEAAMEAYVRENGKTNNSKLVQVGRQAAAEYVKSKKQMETPKFETNKVYVNKSGQKAKYGGKDASGKDIWLKV